MVVKAILKPDRERTVLTRHPWIFSGAIDSIIGAPANGEPVLVCSSKGQALGWGGFSKDSNIRIRMWSYDESIQVNRNYFQEKILLSAGKRNSLNTVTNAMRLIYAESDGLPGLIVDKYGDMLAVQFLSAGIDFYKEDIVNLLDEILRPALIYERSDVEVRVLEGLTQQKGYLKGHGKPTQGEIFENGIKYLVDVASGQKTGFYLDQRKNRRIVSGMAEGKDCLNCFCYTGGFSLNMLKSAANSVTSIDSSQDALTVAQANIVLNELTRTNQEWIEADVFQQLRKFRDQGRDFDLIVLDPPKFAPTRSQVEKASRAYKDINLLALKLLRKNGMLLTFSCSGAITMDLFQKIIAGAAHDSGKEVRVLDWLHQDEDHPVSLNFPESLYLKGLICQV